jgi:hypothetical protein
LRDAGHWKGLDAGNASADFNHGATEFIWHVCISFICVFWAINPSKKRGLSLKASLPSDGLGVFAKKKAAPLGAALCVIAR